MDCSVLSWTISSENVHSMYAYISLGTGPHRSRLLNVKKAFIKWADKCISLAGLV